jgi:hypothetical protein
MARAAYGVLGVGVLEDDRGDAGDPRERGRQALLDAKPKSAHPLYCRVRRAQRCDTVHDTVVEIGVIACTDPIFYVTRRFRAGGAFGMPEYVYSVPHFLSANEFLKRTKSIMSSNRGYTILLVHDE